ncbi:hypothetical protein RU639_013579 [Aspergillus parasiticus]
MSAPEGVQLEQHKSFQDVHHLTGQHPSSKSRDATILQFKLRCTMNQRRNGKIASMVTSSMPPPYYPCTSPLYDLEKIMIKDLQPGTHHRGTYLLLRSVTSPDEMKAITAIVEDEGGSVVLLQLHNWCRERQAQDILPESAVLIVKEPYLELISEMEYGIRVDHVSDVVFLGGCDERIPAGWQRPSLSIEDWKRKGDDFLDDSDYHMASECYTKALDCWPTDYQTESLRFSRATSFINANRFADALSDLDCLQISESVQFHKALALYGLTRYRECCEILGPLSDNTAAKDLYSRASNRIDEQEHGRYHFKGIYAQAAKVPYSVDCAPYIGPVAVRQSGSRGRGLFTTKAVAAGGLLLCEKAFAHVLGDSESDSMTMSARSDLRGIIAQKLYQNPAAAPAFTDLYHGSYKPLNTCHVDGKPVVDTYLVERIITLNGFGCPSSSREFHLSGSSQTDQFPSCGIWPNASYINHSCDSNAERSFIGDMIIIRASRDIQPNTEITFWYTTPNVDEYDAHREKLHHWGFRCECVICEDYENTAPSVLQRRMELRKEARQHVQYQGRNMDPAMLEGMLASLADTYTRPACEVPRLAMWDIQRVLAKRHLYFKKPNEAIRAALAVLTSLGYIVQEMPLVITRWGLMMDHLVETWLILAEAYQSVDPAPKAQAEEYAKVTYKICVGEDETFGDTYVVSDE